MPATVTLRGARALSSDISGGDAFRGSEIASGRFSFLNEERPGPSWHDPDVSQLWQYHLHYFDYVRDLAATGGGRDSFERLAKSWMQGNRAMAGDGWHPYTVSVRLVNWVNAVLHFGDLHPNICRSIYAQARFLAAHIEKDVRGNHIIKNLRALIWCGLFFDGEEANRWWTGAIEMLRHEVEEQILSDGGHFERAPGYHLQVRNDLAATSAWLTQNATPIAWLDAAVTRMSEFARVITPPDGRLPLLKDTVRTAVPTTIGLDRSSSFFLRDSGFAVVRDHASGDFMIADFGRVCPDYLPAHAHADMFSFELTIGGTPHIVDSGVFEYRRGEWRNWFRSTAAHNTVEVEGQDQSEMYDSFRVGRRARLREVSWHDDERASCIRGTHDGYMPVLHRRTIYIPKDARVWIVIDELLGEGRTIARSFLHAHPALPVSAERIGSASVTSFGSGRIAVVRGWYSEDFSVKVENRVLTLEVEGTLPLRFGFVICAQGRAVIDGDVIRVAERTFEITGLARQ